LPLIGVAFFAFQRRQFSPPSLLISVRALQLPITLLRLRHCFDFLRHFRHFRHYFTDNILFDIFADIALATPPEHAAIDSATPPSPRQLSASFHCQLIRHADITTAAIGFQPLLSLSRCHFHD
jgi:hypothetical protein